MNKDQASAVIRSATGLDPTQTPLAVETARELIAALTQATAVRWQGWCYDDGTQA